MNSEARKVRGCAFFVLAIMASIYVLLIVYPWQAAPLEDDPESGEAYGDARVLPPTPPVEKVSDRLKEIDGLQYRDPDQALQLCRQLLAQSDASEAEKLGASQRLPKCIAAVFQKRWAAQKFEDCQALAQEIAATHGDTIEGKQIAQHWQQVRSQWLRKATQENDFATAGRLFKEVFEEPDGRKQDSTMHEFRQFVEKRWKASMATGDEDAAESLFSDAFFVLSGEHLTWVAEQFAEFKAARWKKFRDSGDSAKAEAQLLQAAPYYGLRLTTVRDILYKLGGPFSQALQQQWNTSELLAHARTFSEQNSLPAAMTFLGAALHSVTSKVTYDAKGVPTTTTLSGEPYLTQARQIREQLDAAGLALARKIHKDGIAGIRREAAESLYVELANSKQVRKDPAMWNTVCSELLELQFAHARQDIGEGKIANAQQKLENIVRRTAVDVWEAHFTATGADPFAGVPQNVLSQVDKAAASSKKPDRVALLRAEAAAGRYIVPQARSAHELWIELGNRLSEQRMLQIIASLNTNREYAFRQLRPLFRNERTSPSAAKAEDGLKNAIRDAAREKQFSALNDLCGFFLAELGPPKADDAFREDMRLALKASAAEFAKSSPMTRVFILSLLADLLRGDPAGEQARKEAMEKGLEIMRTIQSRDMAQPDSVVPSLINGMSVQAIENATQYHLMVFMDGPEQCFVRLNPYRKGSMVVKDGKYIIAVVVTADQVIPYRSERTLAGQTTLAKYFIRYENQNAPQNPLDSMGLAEATGDYTLLRAPEGASFTVDPKSGLVRQGAGK